MWSSCTALCIRFLKAASHASAQILGVKLLIDNYSMNALDMRFWIANKPCSAQLAIIYPTSGSGIIVLLRMPQI